MKLRCLSVTECDILNSINFYEKFIATYLVYAIKFICNFFVIVISLATYSIHIGFYSCIGVRFLLNTLI